MNSRQQMRLCCAVGWSEVSPIPTSTIPPSECSNFDRNRLRQSDQSRLRRYIIRLPGIPRNRLKGGIALDSTRGWSLGVDGLLVGARYYSGDESNRSAPLPAYAVASLHGAYRPAAQLEVFASISNLLNRRYATYGLYGNPGGIGAPGVSGNDARFQSPAAPRACFAGVRVTF